VALSPHYIRPSLFYLFDFSEWHRIYLQLPDLDDYPPAVYFPVIALLDGNNPYDPGSFMASYPETRAHFPLYAPIALLIHMPLTLFPFEVSRYLFNALSILMVILLSFFLLKINKVTPSLTNTLLITALIAFCYPISTNIVMGQVGLEVTVASIAALYFARKNHGLSAIALAIACFKPTYGVIIFVFMLARGDWKPALYGALLATVLSLLIVIPLIDSSGGLSAFIDILIADQQFFQNDAAPSRTLPRVDLWSFLMKLTNHSLASWMEFVITLVVLIPSVWIIVSRRHIDQSLSSLSGLVITFAFVLSIYHQVYDLPILLLALSILLFNDQLRNRFPLASIILVSTIVVILLNGLGSTVAQRHFEFLKTWEIQISLINPVLLIVGYFTTLQMIFNTNTLSSSRKVKHPDKSKKTDIQSFRPQP
jgi:hypothetical protein